MSTGGQGTKCRRNIAENCNRLIRVHERYRHDRRTGESTFAKSHMVYHGNTVDTMVTWYTMVDRYHVVLPYPKTIWYTRDYFCGNNRPGIPYFRVWYVSSSSGVATSVSELLYPCYLLTLSLHGTELPMCHGIPYIMVHLYHVMLPYPKSHMVYQAVIQW